MKVKTQLAQLRAKLGNLSYEEIAKSTGIDSQQLIELESDKAEAIAFSTLARLCAFFQCTPNDLLFLDLEEETPLTSLEVAQAEAIVKRAIARAEAMPPRPAAEIWESFEVTVDRIAPQLENFNSSTNSMGVDAESCH
ncbi:MAG: helix-turn-helix transcriptional regulator [Okeania sp. SIO3I5]|uniref:helix-turn-helix domain-containing protein n=1 Tax=Okeania sp. SIO3I5 TaxID=2607805 RepID=UPI0013B6D7B9|nr:helix-turn-helix transcriptional regulator [Okeania sp. SIO3I5]NEQ35713.1 helix-turn-helix transcriptional regulator [Okeania sp. SIO3I5]